MRSTAIRAAASGLATVGVLAGCGHGGGKTTTQRTIQTTTGQATSQVVQGLRVLAVVDVHETEFRLEPKTFGFLRTGYFGLHAINDGKLPHALSVTGPGGVHAHTGTIAPGGSEAIAVWFKKPGTYKVSCPIDGHARRGMTATIRVQ